MSRAQRQAEIEQTNEVDLTLAKSVFKGLFKVAFWFFVIIAVIWILMLILLW